MHPLLTLHYRTARTDEGQRLDELLGWWLPEALGRPLSRSAVRRLLMAGAVVVGDRQVRRPGFLLAAGVRITARLDPERAGTSSGDAPGSATATGILFEDETLLAVSKPAGLLTHRAADPGRADLFSVVRSLLAARAGHAADPGPYLAIHHRLDRETSGIVLFAKAREANEGLARQFERRTVRKTYVAIVSAPGNPPPPGWVVRNHLASVGSGRRARVGSVTEGGEVAETAFRLVEWRKPAALVEAHPLTGRKHQIRAHLAGSGFPIAGDRRYDGPKRLGQAAVPRAMLHALSLQLVHPIDRTPLLLTCPLPEDFLALLRAMRLEGALTPAPRHR